MHNSLQNDIILTLSVFAVIWFLLTYIFHRINKNDDTGDISGALNRDEMRYISKFRRTVRALILSYMYDDYKLRVITNFETNEPVSAYLVRGTEWKYVETKVVRHLAVTKKIKINDVNVSYLVQVVEWKPTAFAWVWCAIVLIRYRSIMKTITDLYY